MIDLTGKVAVVTGGASGLGAIFVRKLHALGAKVLIGDFSEKGQELAASLGDGVRFFKVDVSDEGNVRDMIAAAVDAFGKLDIVVANAGIPSDTPIHLETAAGWQRVVDINLGGVFHTDKYAIEQMRKQGTGGAVINIASILGLVGDADAISYSATKGGVVNLTRSLGVAYAKEGIRVNAIAPGYIHTPLLAQLDADKVKAMEDVHPSGRLGEAEEVANAMAFLASDAASFIVGTTLPVDGGYTAK